MSFYCKTLITSDTSGYVLELPADGCSRLAFGAESGTCWVESLVNQSAAPATPTNALVASSAGVSNAKSTFKLTAGGSRVLDLSSGYSKDNAAVRYTHVRIWAVGAGAVEVLGA